MAKNKDSSDNSLFRGEVDSDISIELLSSTSLFGRTEVAISINGEIVSGIEVIKKKTGTIEVKNVITGTTKITKEGDTEKSETDPMNVG